MADDVYDERDGDFTDEEVHELMRALPRADIAGDAERKTDVERWRQGVLALARLEGYRVQVALHGGPSALDPETCGKQIHHLIAFALVWAMWWGPRGVRWQWIDEHHPLEAHRVDGTLGRYALAEHLTVGGGVEDVAIEVLLRVRDAIDAENRRAAGDGNGWARELGLVS